MENQSMVDPINILLSDPNILKTIIFTSEFLTIAIAFIYVVAFIQGRPISFWPPKIGHKLKKNGVTPIIKSELDQNENSEEAANQTENNIDPKILFLPGYPYSQHDKFFAEVKNLIPKSKKIILIATGLNLIWERPLLDSLVECSKLGKTKVSICLSNPFNPHVEERLIEEKMGDNPYPKGRSLILDHIESLVEISDSQPDTNSFSVKLFEHYLTFATLIFDEDIFLYSYAYKTLGNYSPIIHLKSNNSEEAKFFIDNADRIVKEAFPARDLIYKERNKKYFSQDWIAAAVYIIPDEDDPFYNLGSSVLGYDIRRQKPIAIKEENMINDIRPHVGEGVEYGFHATIADAMFFATQADIERIKAELSILVKDFPIFKLSKLQIVDRTDEEGDIVVSCEDESGVTEALHHELVSRFYRLAISSTYVAGTTKKRTPPKDKKRSELMINRYGAPYILKEFNLHFTLCSAPPANSITRNQLLQNLNNLFEEKVHTNQIQVGKICLLERDDQENRWKITEEYQLKK
ncbi:Protein of unknown function (DUF1045) [Xenococcus sp. PCC 7305]|uniref:DUF1045 domain-containing protein n=1 Tax=Xenococcus sp. PCC 7305 TaxID=102125 RepID=UPI0002ACF150|nr:DUF1045 domain-containing protein [Xenococcus sp. PCC 7305]ELS01723.1 Protein of unknown function (DUF1045) [Xenococcus sp. PCC 7305]